jgi:two-component system sensor histidine kinase HydH
MDHFLPGLLIGFLGSLIVSCVVAAVIVMHVGAHGRRMRRSLARIRAVSQRRIARLQAKAQSVQRWAEVGTFTGGLAHEIKNPLSTVLLNLQLLQEDLDSTDPAYSRLSARLSTVSREAARLRDILDDFLRFAGKLELRKAKVDLNAVLEELVDFFTPQAQLSRVQLRFNPRSSPVMVEVDPRLIKQTILNLLINALHAMPNGGELILTAGTTENSAVVDVIDTGSGIPAEAIDKIFQAYYSTKKGGTGLGLAMAQRIVREHGGQLSVSSEPGKGSDFRLTLPLAEGGVVSS